MVDPTAEVTSSAIYMNIVFFPEDIPKPKG